jgi:hypothetical protein
MSEFHDPELRQQLGRLSGPYPDDNVAFAQWQRRVGHVRRRRAVAWTSGAAMSLVFATVGAAALQNQTRHALVPSNTVDSSVETTIRVTTTEVDDSSTTTSTNAATSTTTIPVDTTPSTEVAVDSSAPEPESTDGGATGGDGQPAGGTASGTNHNNSGGSPTPTPTPAPTAAPATAAPASGTKSFSSVGGSITVRQDGDRLTIIATTAAPGFSVEKGDGKGREVSVKFTSASHTSEISVKLSNAAMKGHVSEHDDPQGGSDHTDPSEPEHT